MPENFNPSDLRQLADDVEALERQAGGADLAAADIPNPCDFYRGTLRPILVTVQGIVCNGWVKRLIGPVPCTAVGQAITLLDGFCPG
jgi:hypothetical protein